MNYPKRLTRPCLQSSIYGCFYSIRKLSPLAKVHWLMFANGCLLSGFISIIVGYGSDHMGIQDMTG